MGTWLLQELTALPVGVAAVLVLVMLSDALSRRVRGIRK